MITVCLTTYNGEKFIEDQLDSIICQLSDKDEIIVSDDASTDKTVSIIENYNDNRIKIIKTPDRKGVIGNVESALEQAKGDYIFLADQDDIWLPNKVEVCINALSKYDLVISDCLVTDENRNIIHESFYEVNKSQSNKWMALLKNSYLGCCMAFRRDILDKALPFPENIPMHDIWIGNIAAFFYSVKFIPDKLIYFRRHQANHSTASAPSKTTFIEKIKYRIIIISGLLKRKLSSTLLIK